MPWQALRLIELMIWWGSARYHSGLAPRLTRADWRVNSHAKSALHHNLFTLEQLVSLAELTGRNDHYGHKVYHWALQKIFKFILISVDNPAVEVPRFYMCLAPCHIAFNEQLRSGWNANHALCVVWPMNFPPSK